MFFFANFDTDAIVNLLINGKNVYLSRKKKLKLLFNTYKTLSNKRHVLLPVRQNAIVQNLNVHIGSST